MMAGATLVGFVNYRTFWNLFHQEKVQATGVLAASARFSRLNGIGAALLIVTGAAMIALTQGAFASQLWFRIKIVFVILLIINGGFWGRRLDTKLAKITSARVPVWDEQALRLEGQLRVFYLMQFAIFLVIIFLSAYKFN